MGKQTAKKNTISRRKFFVRGGLGTLGVLAIGTYALRNPIRRKIAGLVSTLETPYQGDTSTPMIWFEVTEDNTVVLYSPKVEMGQGTFTGLAQLAAEELEIDVDQIKVTHSPTLSGNFDAFATGGSNSISSLWIPLRELAATFRALLLVVAARQLETTTDALNITNGIVSDGQSQITFAQLAEDAESWDIPDTPSLKPSSEFKWIGKEVARVDLEDKVFGAPIFGMDASMPDMLYGSILRPEMIGATLANVNVAIAEQMPGVVQIVVEPDFVGVVASSYTAAENAKAALEAEWNTERIWQTQDIESLIEVGKGKPYVIQKEGNSKSILKDDENTIISEYKSPIGAHAQMEPNGAVAYVEADKVTVIMSTQVVKITRDEIAERLGISADQVDVRPTFLGGGFGRRLHTPNGIQAAVLSKAVGKPVKCFLNRQEEFQHDSFRPPTHHLLKAKLDEQGKLLALEHNVSSGDVAFGSPMIPRIAEPILGADLGAWRGGLIQYGAIPNYRAISWRVKLPFATSWWRSLGLLANTFAVESFMDELAVNAKKDPVQFRLDHIQDDERGYRLKEVIQAAAKKAGWKDGVHTGKAMGFAASTDANTPCAQIVEVSMEEGQIKVHKVTCAMDPGLVVNPDQVRAQCEGAICMGISASLYEQMRIEDGALQPVIYGPYQMALLKHAPQEIDVVLLENAGTPGAVGEPPLGPIGAAIANAVYRLTGKRVRQMPVQAHLG